MSVSAGTGVKPAAHNWVSGARILITGAAGALGQALVAESAAQGAKVVATGRKPSIDSIAFAPGVRVIPADLSRPSELEPLIERSVGQLGGLDILINNAAVLVRRPFNECTVEDFDQAWAVNVRAPVLLAQAATPHLAKGNYPVIINVVSTSGIDGGPDGGSAPYALTKAALIVATRSIAKQLGPQGIRAINLVPPSMSSANRNPTGNFGTSKRKDYLGNPGTVHDVARVAMFLSSPMAMCISGATVHVNAFAY
jgi:NAD(P)-dependent dehydrogenase (short-subunit alcohol dehydrogenase family)